MRPPAIVAATRPRQIAVAATIFVVVATLLTLGVAVVIRMSSGPAAKPASSAQPSQVRHDAHAVEPQVPPGQAKAVADEVVRLRNSAPVKPRISSSRNRIAGEASRQPDLYASAFVKELLTQNYQSSRDDLLSWVQAESAVTTEPRVVGLIPPELRSKWAVFSVSSGPTPPVPTIAGWTSLGLRQGRSTVQIQRVVEPVPWSTAVAAGEISDPGVTAREVTALVTLHTTEAGIDNKIVTSVALTLNIEGPPALPQWRFVGAITYDAVLASRS
jgi:hypothetical protein